MANPIDKFEGPVDSRLADIHLMLFEYGDDLTEKNFSSILRTAYLLGYQDGAKEKGQLIKDMGYKLK